MELSRKSFLAGAGAGMAMAACAAASMAGQPANADEAAESSADVIIVGAGLAGVCAGVRLLELGLKPLIVEKMSEGMHGNSAIAGGAFSVPMTPDEEGIEKYVESYRSIAEYKNDESLWRAQAENAQRVIDWMIGYGVDMPESVQEVPFEVNYYTVNPGSYQGMGAFMETMWQAYVDLGGESLFETKMLDLARNEQTGAIDAIIVRDSSGLKTIRGKAIVLATGGFCGNDELLERWIGENADEMTVRGRLYATGDGIVAASKVGAQLCTMAGMQAIHVAAVSPDNIAFGNPGTSVPFCVGINSEGKRFVDESKGYQNHGKAVIDQPGSWDSLIFDQAALDNPDCAALVKSIDSFDTNGIPYIVADTLDELAEKIGVDAEVMKATIDEYNAAIVDNAVTGLEVPKANSAYPVSTPPFYAFSPLKPGCTLTFGGVRVDAATHVLEADGTIIPGLYAAGETTGGFFAIDYVAGGSLSRSAVFGVVAAETIAEELG